jgi:hypothetical protein
MNASDSWVPADDARANLVHVVSAGRAATVNAHRLLGAART